MLEYMCAFNIIFFSNFEYNFHMKWMLKRQYNLVHISHTSLYITNVDGICIYIFSGRHSVN